MDFKNLPVTPLLEVNRNKQQETLIEHNRLLGTLLGETIFTYAGLDIYHVIEHFKEASTNYYKNSLKNSRQTLSDFCSGLSDEELLKVVRSFTHFSVLANIAEDVYQTHQQRSAKFSNALQVGTLEKSLKNLEEKGISQEKILEAMRKVSVVPVLTAHPTQVQRKSILDLIKKLTDIFSLTPVDYKEIKHDTDFQLKLQTADYTLWQRYSIEANFTSDGSPFYYSVRAQHTIWE